LVIQEIWQRRAEINNVKDLIDIKTREDERGGGTATLCDAETKLEMMDKFEVNKDSNAFKLRLRNVYIWLVNIYLSKGNCSKIQKLFGKLRKNIPQNEWSNLIVIGDFNVDLNKQSEEKELLIALAKQMGLSVADPSGNTRKQAKLDYLIRGMGIKVTENSVLPGVSDHKAVWWKIEVSNPKKKSTLKIPDRRCADEIMEKLLKNKRIQSTTHFFHGLGALRARRKRNMMKLLRPRKFRLSSLFDQLMSAQDCHEAISLINKYWKRFWNENESLRFSQESRIAYQNLKRILKYHLFEKRDGAIINSILKENNVITSDPKEIEQNLLTTMQEIQVDHNWPWIEKKQFPRLKVIDEQMAMEIIAGLATNKAIAFDGCSDILFKENKDKKQVCNRTLTARKLCDIWRTELNEIQEVEDTWDARLVPLNKVFPQIPTRTQLRPIVVQSPLIKIMEGRFLRKLQDYLIFRLDRSQTGFVPGLSVQVNITRALDRIKLRTDRKQPVYGLFIDFSNAYNRVPHTKLFEKLRNKHILEEDETQFLEQMYARYRLKLGGSRLKCNKGVAQGSIISPALFDIYIEDLSQELMEASLNAEDILCYADDILILCTSFKQLEECIEIIEKWSKMNGMDLNKNKSGIVIFGDRRAKKIPKMTNKNKDAKSGAKTGKQEWIPSQETFGGIPICSKYKYLGTWLNSKLTCGPQIRHIRKKAAHLFTKLYPYLSNASADARRDMWQTMVAPLFNAALILLEFEPSLTHKLSLERVRRMTFKQFMMISKRTNTQLVNDLIRKDLRTLAQLTVNTSRIQWEQRKARVHVTEKLPILREKNGLRGVPNSFCDLINTQTKQCPKCKEKGTITNAWHLKYKHGVQITNINRIWRTEILPITENERNNRLEVKKIVEPIILNHLNVHNQALSDMMKSDVKPTGTGGNLGYIPVTEVLYTL